MIDEHTILTCVHCFEKKPAALFNGCICDTCSRDFTAKWHLEPKYYFDVVRLLEEYDKCVEHIKIEMRSNNKSRILTEPDLDLLTLYSDNRHDVVAFWMQKFRKKEGYWTVIVQGMMSSLWKICGYEYDPLPIIDPSNKKHWIKEVNKLLTGIKTHGKKTLRKASNTRNN